MEMEAVIDPKDAREVELRVLRSPDGSEQTRIRFFMQGWQRNKNARALSIDVSEASLSPDVLARPPETGLALPGGSRAPAVCGSLSTGASLKCLPTSANA